MNVTVEKMPKCLTEVSTKISAEEVAKEKASILSSYMSQAQIPGFRPGKAPKRVIEKRYGKEVEGELEYQFLNKLITHTVQEEKISFLDINDRKVTHEEDGSLTLNLSLIVSPEFDLPDYKGIEMTVPSPELTDEEVEGQIELFSRQHAEYPDKAEGAVEDRDIAVISYSSTCEGQDTSESFEVGIEPFDKKDGYWIQVGEDHFLPGFSEQLTNMVVGSEKVISHTFADDFRIEELQGKTFDYTVTVNEIKTEQVPSLGELATKLMGEEGTEESLREQLSASITQQKEKQVKDLKVTAILQELGDQLDFDLPESFLTAETQSQADTLVQQGMEYGMDEDSVMKVQESIIETAQEKATTSLKNHFILQKIANLEEITAEDSEVQTRILMDAYQRGEDIQKAMQDKKGVDDYQVRQSIIMDKVVDFLVEEAKVTIEDAKELNDDN